MLDLRLNLPGKRAPCFLFIGAHCDDIEIGCGGTIMELLRRYPKARIHWVVLSSNSKRASEARMGARLILGAATRPTVTIKDFRESYFPSEVPSLMGFFEELKPRAPDVVFSLYGQDLHQDHRVVSELTWNTFRNHMILEYEIPKYDGGLGSPSFFVPVPPAVMRKKVAVLMKAFPTQTTKHWFSPDTFQGLMRLRGIESNAPGGYAEAFYVRKLVLGGPGA